LIKIGFGGKLLNVIQNMFLKAGARVRWQGLLGSNIDSTHGVLQGGIISPKLFNLYLSDLNEYLDQSNGIEINNVTFTHLLYADDLVLVSDTSSGMQKLLDNLASYCRKWHLLINTDKSKIMVIQSGRQT
jgi:retron-type reverse transcriptase